MVKEMAQENRITLLALVRGLASLLVPVCPRAEFRAELHRSLVADARRLQAQQKLAFSPPLQRTLADWPTYAAQWLDESAGRRWVVGAAAIGSAASLIGVLAYALYRRSRPVQAAHGWPPIGG